MQMYVVSALHSHNPHMHDIITWRCIWVSCLTCCTMCIHVCQTCSILLPSLKPLAENKLQQHHILSSLNPSVGVFPLFSRGLQGCSRQSPRLSTLDNVANQTYINKSRRYPISPRLVSTSWILMPLKMIWIKIPVENPHLKWGIYRE